MEYYCVKCKKDTEADENNKYKDIITLNGIYYTVWLTVCEECGNVIDDQTWIE